jgi:multidrug efflux pump subunit AcrB
MGSNISAWAIRNPIPVIVLFIALTAAGWVSFDKLRINNGPDLDLPAVTVTVTQPGAAPAEMETEITRKIEDAVVGLGNVNHIKSNVSDGLSVTTVEFEYGKNTDRAVNDLRDAVTKIRSDLPGGIQEPVVARVDGIGTPIVNYAVSSKTMTEEEISWLIDNDISRLLLSVHGVSQVRRAGGVDRMVRVNLDPDRLMALGITADEVNKQLRLLNVNRPGGRGTVGAAEQSIRTLGSARSIEELREARIILSGGRTAKLADLGSVDDAAGEKRQLARMNNAPVVAFGVIRSVGSSEVDVADHVAEKLQAFAAERPDIAINMVSSSTKFARESYLAAIEALLLGAALAVLVVWWFLRDLRATLISATAMPLAALPTFAVMLVSGFTLNNIVMLGLSLVIGILVDDAIVEIENIVRHMRMGKKPYMAALEAADEIGLAVVATTLTIMAVFVPVAFIGGIPGQYFSQFGLTVAAAVFFSLVVARLLTPLMAAYLLKSHGESDTDGPLMTRYLALLRWCLAHRRRTVIAGVGFFVVSVLLVPLVPRDFIPAGDRAMTVLSLELPPGATLAETDGVAQQATRLLLARPEVVSVYASIGAPTSQGMAGMGMSVAGDVRKASLTINLKPKGERKLNQQQFEADVRGPLSEIPGIRMKFGAGNGIAKATVTLASNDPIALEKATQQLTREMMTLPTFANVGSSASLRRPEIQIRPNLGRAAELGISVDTISTAAKIATIGDIDANLAKFNLADRQIPILVQLTERARGDLRVLENLRVSGPSGTSVPLGSIAEISFGSGPAQIDRLDRQRYASVEAETGGIPLGTATKQIHDLPIFKNMPAGVAELKYGDAEQMAELFGSIGLALATGIFMVYAVLVILFGSFIQPLTIMTSLPLSLGGAVTLMLLTQTGFSLPALIGTLMLMGIVAKNSILLVEYAVVAMRDRGLSRRDALLDAAHKRARPIVMTTIAMVAGMLPIALRLGADAEFRAPMAICVIGGLLTSTGLSLIFVPVAFTYLDDIKERLRSRLRNALRESGREADRARPSASAPAAE